jgi:hypothetical protein
MVERWPVEADTDKAESWVKLFVEQGCLNDTDLIAPPGKRLEIVFAADKVGPIHHDHGLTKARIEGLYIRREHLDNVTYFRLDEILCVTLGRER